MRAPDRLSIALVVLAIAAGCSLGCAGGRPKGPVFEPLAPPDAASTLVYIYRLDTLRGADGARIKLDGERIATLRNGEYVAFVVDPGEHEVRASLLWLGFLTRSWNGLKLKADGGETLFVRVWAATEELAAPPADAQIPGRAEQRGTAGLFMRLVDRTDAELELRAMRRGELD